MITENELLHLMALQRVPNLGDISIKKLLRAVGSAEGVIQESKNRLAKIEGIGSWRLGIPSLSSYLPQAEAELRFLQTENIEWLYFEDRRYPEKLKHCIDGPVLLFQKGNVDLQKPRILSIVGTRRATSYGIHFCETLVEELAVCNPVIVSGFAYGIDITAQRKAMELGLQTVGCLAHGLNQTYPPSHKKYRDPIEQHGGFLTEFWSDDVFDRNNFLKRNRVIAGISSATVVVESAARGGSLVTADIAHSYDRDVFAVPGRVGDSQSEGCNTLIKTQKGQMICSAADLIYALGWDLDTDIKKVRQTELFFDLNPEEQKVVDLLQKEENMHIDLISLKSKIPTPKLASLLLQMELKGLIQPLPGKLFKCY